MTMETKYPLRIDRHTIIYVTADKCNEEYAQLWRERRDAKNKAWNNKHKSEGNTAATRTTKLEKGWI